MKVKPSNLRTVSAAVRTTEQGIRKAEQTVRAGLTSSVIGAEEEQSRSGTKGTKQRRIPEGILNRISTKNRIQSDYRQEHPHGSRNLTANKSRTTDKVAGRAVTGTRAETDTAARGVGTASRGAGTATRSTDTAVRGTGTAAKGAGVAVKGTNRVAGVGVKGAAVTAGAASGVATAGTTTAATVAVKGAVRIAKRAASVAQEALEVSVVKKNSSRQNNSNTGNLQFGKKNKGSNGKMGFMVLSIGILLIPIVPLSLFIALFIPLASLKGDTDAGAGNAVSIVAAAEQELLTSDENIGGGKYKSWYGMDANWCAMFVSWCANQCGYLDAGIMPKTASVAVMKSWYENNNSYHIKESGYEPRAGDVVIFLRGRSHTGIVVAYDPDTKILTTIEGNTGTSTTSPYYEGSHVRQKQYPLTYAAIDGYGSPSYPEN